MAPKAAMIFRPYMGVDLKRADCLSGARLFYSLWDGYLNDGSQDYLLEWLTRHDIPLTKIHTSGHASVADLKRFAQALAPKRLVPIHSFEPGRYPELFDNVEPHTDGEWWEV